MKKGIFYYRQEFWNQLKETLADKCGELPFGDISHKTERSEMKIGKTLYIVTIRYSGRENIVDKFKRLIVRKLESQSDKK